MRKQECSRDGETSQFSIFRSIFHRLPAVWRKPVGADPTVTRSRHTLVLKTRPSTGQDWLPCPTSLSAGEAEFGRAGLHGGDAELDMGVQIDAELGGAVNDIVAIDGAREGLILQLFLHRFQLHLRHAAAGFHVGAGSEKARKFIAGEEVFFHRALAWDAAK